MHTHTPHRHMNIHTHTHTHHIDPLFYCFPLFTKQVVIARFFLTIYFCVCVCVCVCVCLYVCVCVYVCVPPFSSRGFSQSISLPTACCVGGVLSARRSMRQFQMPSRSLPGARLGLLGTAGLLGPTPRSASTTPTPTGLKQEMGRATWRGRG